MSDEPLLLADEYRPSLVDLHRAILRFTACVENGSATTAITRRIAPRRMVKIILVDDDPDWPRLVTYYLRDQGIQAEITATETMVDLEHALARTDPELVLCDHSMPAFSSADALLIARRFDRNIPFIILSGVMPENSGAAAMAMGADDWISKDRLDRLAPVILRELRKR